MSATRTLVEEFVYHEQRLPSTKHRARRLRLFFFDQQVVMERARRRGIADAVGKRSREPQVQLVKSCFSRVGKGRKGLAVLQDFMEPPDLTSVVVRTRRDE